MNLFGRLVPPWVPLAIIGVLLVLLLGQQAQVSNAKARASRTEATLATERATAATAALAAETAARAEESRRTEATRKVVQDAKDQAKQARADAADASRAAGGLRQRIAALVAASRSAASNPASGGRGTGEQGADSLDLLVEVLNRHSRSTTASRPVGCPPQSDFRPRLRPGALCLSCHRSGAKPNVFMARASCCFAFQ